MRFRRLRRQGVFGRSLVAAGLLAVLSSCHLGSTQSIDIPPHTSVTQPAGSFGVWRAVQSPDVPTDDLGRFGDLAVFSATSALAAGTRYVGPSGQCAAPALDEWDGMRWQTWPHPLPPLPAGTCGGQVLAMSASSLSDVWVITTALTSNTAVYHWNGARWYAITDQGLPRRSYLEDLSVTADHVVAVGYHEDNNDGRSTVLATYHRGSNGYWSTDPTEVSGRLVAVSQSADDNAYAVGDPQRPQHPAIVFHWNGATWHQVDAPNVQKSSVADVATSGPGDVLIVGDETGQEAIGPGAGTPEVLHLHDGAWSTPQLPVVNGFLTAVVATGDDIYWAAGLDQAEVTTSNYFRLRDDLWSPSPGPRRATAGTAGNQYVEIDALGVVPDTTSIFGVGFTATSECDSPSGCGRAIAGQFVIDQYS